MKRLDRKATMSLLTILLVASAFTVGCSKSMGSSNNNNGNSNNLVLSTTGAASPTQTVLNGTGGSQAPLTLTSKSALDSYTGWVTNSPSNESIAVNLQELATRSNGAGGTDYEFGGAVSIAFTDSGSTYIDTFSSHLQGAPNTVNSDVQNNEYNLVSTQYPGIVQTATYSPGYHGFFQGTTYCDGYPMAPGQYCPGQVFGGSVILVLNQMGFNADGEGATTGSGSIWFYNFTAGNGTGPIPGTSCWFITLGPYQCGSFFNGGDSIQTKSSLNPTVTYLPNSSTITYTELGTFTGLDLNGAFNNQLQ